MTKDCFVCGMLNVVNQIINAVQIPFFILLIMIGGILFLSKRKAFYLFFITVSFMLFWRLFFNINASRYCVSFLIILVCSLAISLKDFRCHTHLSNTIICIVSVCFLVFNFIKLFSGFRDVYWFDLRDDMSNILFNDFNDIVFVLEKDYNRIHVTNAPIPDRQLIYIDPPLSYDELTSFYSKYFGIYNYLKDDSYFFVPQKKNENISDKIDNGVLTFKEIRHYRTNRKTSIYSIYYHPPTPPRLLRRIDEVNNSQLKDYLEMGVLRAYEPFFDSYVFQINNKLVWLFGSPIEVGSEVIYQIFTDSTELLPKHRQQYGFDNRDFFIRKEQEKKQCGNYVVFEKDLPVEYPITKIRVGLDFHKTVIWKRFFQLSEP